MPLIFLGNPFFFRFLVLKFLPHVFLSSTLSAPFFLLSSLTLTFSFSCSVFFLVIYSPVILSVLPSHLISTLMLLLVPSALSAPFIFRLNLFFLLSLHAFYFSPIILGFSASLFIFTFGTFCTLYSPLNLLFRLSFCAFYFHRNPLIFRFTFFSLMHLFHPLHYPHHLFSASTLLFFTSFCAFYFST